MDFLNDIKSVQHRLLYAMAYKWQAKT